MTTKITVETNHGWPVDAVKIAPTGKVSVERVPAGETRVFHIHSHLDITFHEVQPDELRAEQAALQSDTLRLL